MMDFEGRASRRPMPRRLDVSDWNVDNDVLSGVSSSLARYSTSERATGDTRAAPTDLNRRLHELRPAAAATLRPVNRYDADTVASTRGVSESSGSVSSWRTSGAFMPSTVRRTERTEVRRMMASASPDRLQPRGMQETRRPDNASGYFSTHGSELEESASVRTARDHETARGSQMNSASTSLETESTAASSHPEPSYTYSPPPRDRVHEPTTPATVYSDASTDIMSPFPSSSLTNTPSTDRSSTRTPPFTPASGDTSTRTLYSTSSSAPYAASEVSSDDSTPETDAIPHRDNVASVPESLRPVGLITRTSAAAPRGPSLQQQREQLYDFRRDMRQVFARMDEMVDMHRDLFKSDPMSGMPQFNTASAHEIASFANDTFEQLTALRTKFEDLSKTWISPDDSTDEGSIDLTQRRVHGSRSRQSPSDETSSIDTMRNGSQIASSESLETVEAPSSMSSVASSPTGARVREQVLGLGRPTPISRWEPTLSSLSNRSSSSSSSSSTSMPSPRPSEPPSRLSAAPPVFRPSTDTSRLNVFEDFDKRMEEIRASLNSIARDRPRVPPPPPSPPQSSSSSSWAPSSTSNKFRTCDADSSSDQESTTLENSSRAGNRIHQPASDESRKDREARLRQLLRELRETGDSEDDAASAWG